MFILNPKKHLKKISSNNDNQRVSKLFLYYFGRQMKKKTKKNKKKTKEKDSLSRSTADRSTELKASLIKSL